MTEQEELALSAAAHDRPVILFDGVCHLCSGWVQFAIARDPAADLRFAPIQAAHGQDFLRRRGLPLDRFETFYLIDGGAVFEKSTAVLRMVGYLRWPWPLLKVLRIVPRPLRDWLYDRVARNRYRWFGRRETCLVPAPEIARRFLD
ncbi:MAG TPA: thiol-disulfide oxidoreductase DCC family protein [Candidatus Acidoferrum sp.]|nr:thiol-disulfide oxidoreductase DCC family protein [Candidatus Acidoferrum sp.]